MGHIWWYTEKSSLVPQRVKHQSSLALTLSQIRKKIPFWNYFFHFLPNKMCNSGAARLKWYWSNGMKIMKFIHCYWTQWCSTFISWVLLAPSSVEIFNFWTRRAWRLKFSQNDAHVILHHSYLLRFFVCALFLHLDPLKRP